MDKLIVVVFNNESKAVSGLHALREMDKTGEISVYDAQLIVKDAATGILHNVENVDLKGFPELAGGTVLGTLIGLLGGPAGAFFGAAGGMLVGIIADARENGITDEFVADIKAALTPGKAALCALVNEGEWLAPLDTQMEQFGGVIFRRIRTYEKERQEDIDAAAHRAEMEHLKAERAKARGERLGKIEARIDHLRVKMENSIERRRLSVQKRQQERDAKIKALQAKAEKTEGEIRRRQEARIADLRHDYEEAVVGR